jgi:hypothetical protein
MPLRMCWCLTSMLDRRLVSIRCPFSWPPFSVCWYIYIYTYRSFWLKLAFSLFWFLSHRFSCLC